jgi:hypothetical protein
MIETVMRGRKPAHLPPNAHSNIVIPAKAGIQLRLTDACKLDPDFRRGDE